MRLALTVGTHRTEPDGEHFDEVGLGHLSKKQKKIIGENCEGGLTLSGSG